jgi:hypothetical protein
MEKITTAAFKSSVSHEITANKQQVERVFVAVPQVRPPWQRLFVLDLVEAVLRAQCVDFDIAQAFAMAAERRQQFAAVAMRGSDQRVGQGRRDFTADRAVVERFQQRQTTEVPGDMAVAQEACEKFLERKFHGCCPCGQPGNRQAGTTAPLPPGKPARQGVARRSKRPACR